MKAPSNMNKSYITFEASIHYYHHRSALENMHALLPCSRIIWILRNPLSRAFSEYLHQAVKSKEYPTFEFVVKKEVEALRVCSKKEFVFESGFDNPLFRCLERFKLKKYMLSTGFYAYFIHAWLEKFPVEQHLFLDYERFKADPEFVLRQITNFLHIPYSPILKPLWKYNKANTNDGKAAKLRKQNMVLKKELLNEVERYVGPHVEELYKTINEDFGWNLKST